MVTQGNFMLKKQLKNLLRRLYQLAEQAKSEEQRRKLKLLPTVNLDAVEVIGVNLEIGEQTYINRGTTLSTGKRSRILIGRYCAIGRYVHIAAKTHALTRPTQDEDHANHAEQEADVLIGDYVWIGDHVYVREGVTIGDYAVIATNSVVNRDVKPFEIVGGAPIRHIRYNTEHYRYQHR